MLGLAILAAIALRFLLPRWQKAPPNQVASVVARARGVRPTGPDGTWTRRDRLREAGYSSTVALFLLGLAWIGVEIEQRTLNGSSLNMVGGFLLLLGALGLVMAILTALISLGKAAMTPRTIDERSA
jgi:hypothetical protein